VLAISRHEAVAAITLQRPPANALNAALVSALRKALGEQLKAGTRAIILSGQPGMFSGGLDVPELINEERPAIAAFWKDFFALTRELVACPVPVIAALSGHAPAGGAVLAMCCDVRIAAAGRFRIGLNEVQVGLPVPSTILRSMARLIGERAAARLAMRGELLLMEDAAALGLVDEVVPAEELATRALAVAGELLALPPVAMNQTRLIAKAELVSAIDAADDAAVATEYWFSAETQTQMRALVKRLSGS